MSQPTGATFAISQAPSIVPRYVPDDSAPTTQSVVHVTITQAGTVVYTQTATSYSYIPSYSTVGTTSSPTSASTASKSTSGTNMGAIIGGAVGGGFALIALIGGLLFFLCKRENRKNHLYGRGYAVDNESHINYTQTNIDVNKGLIPRQLIAPLERISGDAGYAGDGTTEELISADYNSPKGYFIINRTDLSLNSDSLPSTTFDSNAMLSTRHVPNEIGPSLPEDKPHLKEHEPPHLRD